MEFIKIRKLGAEISSRKLKKNSSVALIFCEDDALIDDTVNYFTEREFNLIILVMNAEECGLDRPNVINLFHDFEQPAELWHIINTAMFSLNGHWLYWGYNAEFLYYPFCDTRTIKDISEFLMGERRLSLPGAVIDLYPRDIQQYDDGVSLGNTYFDRINYYSADSDLSEDLFTPSELKRIKRIYGGLHWRFAEHIPKNKRRIDRVPYFYVTNNLRFNDEGICDREEFYTYQTEHHCIPSSAVMSFRIAKYLRHNHETRHEIHDFMWEGSQYFQWNPTQLLHLGIIETGQWF